MGALANDVGFLPTASFCGRLRGEFLNMTAVICGNRLGRGLVRPGGAAFDVDAAMIEDLTARMAQAERDILETMDETFSTPSVTSRYENTGVVSAAVVADLGLVGMAARSCGVARDARADHPLGRYVEDRPETAVWPTGDVMARAIVRRLEIERSIAYVKGLLGRLPDGPARVAVDNRSLRPNHMAVALTEGWRGEIAHVTVTDERGRFARYKIVDPSFHNWSAMAMALRGGQISDFPLCNKSFNLSYCGFDL